MLILVRRLLVTSVLAIACQYAPDPRMNQPEAPIAVASVAAGTIRVSPPQRQVQAGVEALEATREHSSVAKSLSPATACSEQTAQSFLVDAHFNGRSLKTAAERTEWRAVVQRSIRYRTEKYGYFEGFGNRKWNTRPLRSQLRSTRFFGVVVRLHEKVIPALHCVQQAITLDCAAYPYKPRALSGVREKNTYFDGDVSNHVYGIAIDIDPLENPCCNCTEPWRSSPRCRGNKTAYERMDMPECWVKVFERFGFYWLGHDQLEDTMHFEFLGDPDKIARAPALPAG